MHHPTQASEAVYTTLVGAAQRRSRVFHVEVSAIVESLQDTSDSANVTDVLRHIAEVEHRAGRPLLIAIVVTGKAIPGEVFFDTARRLGLLSSTNPSDEMAFWMEEERRVYEFWTI